MADELETLKRELARARAEIEELNLRLSNAILMLKKEMLASGKIAASGTLPKPMPVRLEERTVSK